MSKERLEKAKKILNHIKGYGVYDGNDDIEIFEWLIEQADRVQELEEEVDRLNGALHYQLSQENIRNEENRKLRKQNKHYQEAIEVAIRNMAASDNLGVKFALGVLEQALEGRE